MKYKTRIAHFIFSKAGHALPKINFLWSNARDFSGSVSILAPNCDFYRHFKYKTRIAHFIFSKAGHALPKINFLWSNARDFSGSVSILAPNCYFYRHFAVGK